MATAEEVARYLLNKAAPLIDNYNGGLNDREFQKDFGRGIVAEFGKLELDMDERKNVIRSMESVSTEYDQNVNGANFANNVLVYYNEVEDRLKIQSKDRNR